MKISEIQPRLFKHFEKLVQNNHLSHAYLFIGGFGSYEMTIWLAQAIFCQEAVKPCGHCRACQLVRTGDFSDLHEISADGQTIKVDQIRDLLETISSTGFESSQKVIIIREAEKMGLNAANALLKPIEEPESEVYIFLLSENENLLLPTIQSRMQKVYFAKDKPYLLEALRVENIPESQANLLAEISDSIEEALDLAKSDWFPAVSQSLQAWTKKLQVSREDAFLDIPSLTAGLEGKAEQEKAFEMLLVLLNETNLLSETEKTFKAERMWRANVRFQSCLESILI